MDPVSLGWESHPEAKRYNYPTIYVTESGTSVLGESDKPIDEILDDTLRTEYFDTYVKAMAKAVSEDGCKVQGYMAWSLLDNFEWAEGYVTRFGVTYVDYENDQKRYPKKSAKSLKALFESVIEKS
ncbi:hypothetical protein BN1708_005145 [Verticillium longisporum]|uniref:Beta-glucosidase n=1 Tax=Verticillium longisporum TaxID=100787 RepID=A0A0G4M876_VERLO|nr:hypothetical protein BN1708_005145 [Verticillium longisporum]